MSEEFLYYLWRYKNFDHHLLQGTLGEDIQVIKSGQRNEHSGPDFFNAKIKIDNILWGGNVEIHVRSSDWFKHYHQGDKSYDNVILHVVYEHDREIFRSNGSRIATLVLKGKFNEALFLQYEAFMNSKHAVPCAGMIHEIDPFIFHACLDRMSVERLEQKCNSIYKMLNSNKNNWEKTLLQFLARSFGFKVNNLPFELLIKRTPLKQIKQFSNLLEVEAMLFGTAGMLNQNFQEEYPQLLSKEFKWMQAKWKIISLDHYLWKYMRLRPNNFPSIRIAQLAALLYQHQNLFSKILDAKGIEELMSFFEIQASPYWENHYRFEKESNPSSKHLGKTSIQNLIINALVPVLFAYGKKNNQEEYMDKALHFLEELPKEKNKIIHYWETLDVNIDNANCSQALIQLMSNYCNKKQCLNCGIGNKLLLRQTVS